MARGHGRPLAEWIDVTVHTDTLRVYQTETFHAALLALLARRDAINRIAVGGIQGDFAPGVPMKLRIISLVDLA